MSENLKQATAAANLLFSWCLMPDAHEPKKYLAGVVAIFAEYPQEIRTKLANPVSGSMLISDRPSLVQVRHVLEELMQPTYREAAREHQKLLPEPPIDRSTRPTYEELQQRCARDGLLIGGIKKPKKAEPEEVAEFLAENGVTEEVWNSIPDAE